MTLQITSPYPQLTDRDGSPLDGGFVYIGQPGQNPETNPIQVYWDETTPAPQPLRTSSGYIVRAGTPAKVIAAGDYSMTVKNKDGVLIYYSSANDGFYSLSGNLASPDNGLGADLVANADRSISSIAALRAYPKPVLETGETKVVSLRSYYENGTTGSGTYTWDASSNLADNGGTVINPTGNPSAGRWILRTDGTVLAEAFGVVSDGVTLDDASVLRAVNAVVAGGVPTKLVFERKTALSKSIAVDPALISFELRNAELDFTALTDPQAFLITGTQSGTEWDQRQKVIIGGNGTIRGPGKSSGKTCLSFTSTTAVGNSHLQFENLQITDWTDARLFYSNSYIINFVNCFFQQNARGAYLKAGGTNYGERITDIGCTCGNNDLGYKGEVPGGNFHLLGSSVDYNTKHFELSGGAGAYLGECHVEGNDYPGISPITLTGSGTMFVMNGGVLTGLSALPQSHLSIVDVGADTIACFNDLLINNIRNTASVFATGAGRVFINRHQRFAGTAGIPAFIGTTANFNLLADPGFETTPLVDDWSISQDTAPITSRTTGANITIARTAGGHSGSYSLRITKTTAGANGACAVFYPVTQGQRYAFGCWYEKPIAYTTGGNLFVSLYHARVIYDGNGIPVVTRRESAGLVSVAIPAAGTFGWTQLANVAPGVLPPSWASHVMVEFNLFEFGGAQLDIDDAILSAI